MNLEDCRRWRIAVLCKLVDGGQEMFARLNLLWAALQQPSLASGGGGGWRQWGAVQAEVISPGLDTRHLYMRGVRGRLGPGSCSLLNMPYITSNYFYSSLYLFYISSLLFWYHCGVLPGCGKLYDVFLGGQGTMLQLGRAARTAALFLPGEPPVEVLTLSLDRGTAAARCRACIDNLYNPSIRASFL